jgi:uncharacterized membrane protein YhfC
MRTIKFIYRKMVELIGFCLSIALWFIFGWLMIDFLTDFSSTYVEFEWIISRDKNMSQELAKTIIKGYVGLGILVSFTSVCVIQLTISNFFNTWK